MNADEILNTAKRQYRLVLFLSVAVVILSAANIALSVKVFVQARQIDAITTPVEAHP